MGWSPLGTQFCLELAFGVLLALAFVARAPVGLFFHRLMGTAALVPVMAAIAGSVGAGGARWSDPHVLLAALAVLAYPFYSGPVRSRRRAVALGIAATAVGLALVAVVAGASAAEGGLPLAVASLSALATGSVAGSVGLAMVLGHWYLTVPDMQVRHLERVNRLSAACMLASLGAVALSCWVFAEGLAEARVPLLGPWGLFYLGTRVAVGLLLPLLFAWMTAQTLKLANTRSATGILYASTVLVLIGTAVSISLQDTYGVPL